MTRHSGWRMLDAAGAAWAKALPPSRVDLDGQHIRMLCERIEETNERNWPTAPRPRTIGEGHIDPADPKAPLGAYNLFNGG